MESPRNYRPSILCLACIWGALLLANPGRLNAAACVPLPSGIVAWWPGEGNAQDAQGTNNGTFANPQYGPGEVGSAFSFDGTGNNIRIPASPAMDVGGGNGMTIEAWIYSTDNTMTRPIVEWVPQQVGAFGAHFYVHQTGPGVLYANLYDTAGVSHIIQTPQGAVQTNVYQHVAVTYDKASGTARLFVDGAQSAESVLGTFTPQTSPDLSIGYRPSTVPFGPISYLGRIDEVSLYSRALSSNEVESIYLAGSAGKCSSSPPSISLQPSNQTVFVGSTATFSVLAGGSQPLNYQWTLGGTNLPGATRASLILSNVQPAQAGLYSVVITNTFGSLTSSNALLTVNPPPPCAPPPSSMVAWWPGEESASDRVGNDNGTIMSGVTFVPGLIGQAFNFDGNNGAITLPGSPNFAVQDLTIETWIYPADISIPRPIFEYGNATGLCSLNFWYGLGSSAQPSAGALFGFARDASNPNNNLYLASVGGLLPSNQWSHVAFTFDSVAKRAVLFLNGTVVSTTSFSSPIHPNTLLGINLGYRPIGSSDLYGGRRHIGKLDEITLYGRALATNEIQAIYQAGISGKCQTPVAPYIVGQPTDETGLTGSSVTFSVRASGSQPLSYQWRFKGAELPGQTNADLTITQLQLTQAGDYAVQITNSAGSVTSSNALLTINVAPPCSPPSAGLVSWWPAEGNATDNEGANSGIFTNAAYGPGEVGQAFSFDGTGNNIRVPASSSLDVGAGQGMTIEAWIYSTDNSTGRPLVEWVPKAVGAFGAHFYVHSGGPGVLYANLYGTDNASHIIQSTNGAVALNTNQHVAVTYDKASGVARLYVNGVLIKQSSLGAFTPQTSPDLSIGYRPSTVPFGPIAYVGKIDEVSIYSRALSGPEIQAIYAAGGAGKCNTPAAPAIFSGPTDQTVTIGQTATFLVQAGGTAPLSYQWSLNNVDLPNATNASLILNNVQRNQAGRYSVVVTNAYGSATSSNASLVVNFPPASVDLANTSGAAGQMITVPITLVANGNENAVGFSVNYSPALLANAGVTLGSGASGASLVVNPSQAGTVGIGVALSSGAAFAPGTQEVARISFVAAVSATGFTTPLSFGDQPVQRLLIDPNAQPLPVNFNGSQVTLSRSSFEADLAPRQDGDGKVDIADWVQVGRFVAALDTPSASEFQRADCAPRDTQGDGALTVSDWVQAGRFAAGLDPVNIAGGPTVPAGGQVIVRRAHKKGTDPLRAVTIQGPLIFQGQTATAIVQLEAQGDESAVGFSLGFDPAVVLYAGYAAGADTLGAPIDVNSNEATNGRLGVIVGLSPGTSFSAGTRQLIRISFEAVTSNSVDSVVALTDLPVRREISDTNALPVVATYSNGIIEINPRPSLSITHSNQSVTLAWPLWATNYNLQQALGTTWLISSWTNRPIIPVATTNAQTFTLPLGGSAQFFRLQHQ